MNYKYITKTLVELDELLTEKKAKSREIVEEFIANIEENDEKIGAFLTTTFEIARQMADSSDARITEGKRLSRLDGIPITLKDIVSTKGVKTTAGSKMLENFVPTYNATVWEKLEKSGAVLLGKVNCDEFAMGSSMENSALRKTVNPINHDYVPGGSSGGSSAAVAANFCAGSIGSDTGGSIRQPASFCGVSGLKVSYGRVSRYGVMAMASSLDTIGCLAKTPEDCAIILEIIAGEDKMDGTTIKTPVENYLEEIGKIDCENLKIGIPKEYFQDGISPEVISVVNAAKEILKMKGAKIIDISLPNTKYALATYYVICPSEVSANMARFDGLRYGSGETGENLDEIYVNSRDHLGDEVKRRILLGNYALSAGYYDAYYRKAQQVRTLIKQDFEQAFEQVDCLLAPVSPTSAFKFGAHKDNLLELYMEDLLTIPASLAGICAMSVPVGKCKDGLPIGVQIFGKQSDEKTILGVGQKIFNEIDR